MPLKSRSQAIARLIEKGMAREEPDIDAPLGAGALYAGGPVSPQAEP